MEFQAENSPLEEPATAPAQWIANLIRQLRLRSAAKGMAYYAQCLADDFCFYEPFPCRGSLMGFSRRALIKNNPAVYFMANEILSDKGICVVPAGQKNSRFLTYNRQIEMLKVGIK